MKYKSDDGFTIRNAEGDHMGIHSACVLLNDKIAKIAELEQKLERCTKVLVQFQYLMEYYYKIGQPIESNLTYDQVFEILKEVTKND